MLTRPPALPARTRLLAGALGLALATSAAFAPGALADDDTDREGDSGRSAPSARDVREAQQRADQQARTVAAVQADLALANEQLQRSAVVAAQAAEAYNGAVWRADQAEADARRAERDAAAAQDDVDTQQEAFGDALVTSYEMAPGLTALAAVVDADGIDSVVAQGTTIAATQDAMSGRYDAFRATATVAEVASGNADEARAEAEEARAGAEEARDAAAAAADAAASEATQIAEQKDALVSELARLQGVSVQVAAERQTALEEEAQAAAAVASEEERADAEESGGAESAEATEPSEPAGSSPEPSPQPSPQPAPQPSPQPSPQPAPQPAPAPGGGASAAIAFARAQIGDPYVWAAAGPDAWDCSGLTMAAWQRGGKALPHYSVAQYEQSTPISPSRLAPGDLVFWGSSNDPSSIYHVALYVGGGQIVHAPRTGRPVTQESMYYWITPNFYARP